VIAGEQTPPLTFRERMLGREHRTATLEGDRAIRAMSVLLPALNGGGGSARQVASAVDVVEQRGTLTQLLKQAEHIDHSKWSALSQSGHALPKVLRLAIEMTLHEDAERAAIEGELHELEHRWREADEIAAIADSLTLPERVVERVKSLRGAG
jgi:hypothetical protein